MILLFIPIRSTAHYKGVPYHLKRKNNKIGKPYAVLISFTDVMNGNSKTFSVVSKDMIEEKFSDVHGVSVVFCLKARI